jgi:3-isopropylmalate/(R)-2-methylmalate dehydratase small subunit
MEPFNTLTSVVAPMDRANVDTDALLPKQYMKTVRRTGLGTHLFDTWRWLDRGEPGPGPRQADPDFVLNCSAFAGARILLVRDNFGCGSSREHAVWALHDHGIRALVGPSFADIFFGNCFKNGVLPVVLPAATVDRLFALVGDRPGIRLTIDLASQTLTPEGEPALRFEIEPARRERLLDGIDDIALTLRHAGQVRAYESRRRVDEPWLFAPRPGAAAVVPDTS